MKSTKFGLGFEQHYTTKIERASLLVLLSTLAIMVLLLLGKRVLMNNLRIPDRIWREGIKEFA